MLNELDGLSHHEQTNKIKNHVLNKDYSIRQFETITDAFKNDAEVLKVIINCLQTLEKSSRFIVENQKEAFEKACEVANKTIDNPRSTEKERLNAIKMIDRCYALLITSNVAIIFAIVAVIIIILKTVFGVTLQSNKQSS